MTSTIFNNVIVANHRPDFGGPSGISMGVGRTFAVSDVATLNTTVSNNTVSESAGSGVFSQGLGLRKQDTSITTNAFAINGMSATSTPGVESYVDGLNPNGNGTLLISATSGFANCSLP